MEQNIDTVLKTFFDQIAIEPQNLEITATDHNGFYYIEVKTSNREDVGRLLGKYGSKKQKIKEVLGLVLKTQGFIKSNDSLELRIENK